MTPNWHSYFLSLKSSNRNEYQLPTWAMTNSNAVVFVFSISVFRQWQPHLMLRFLVTRIYIRWWWLWNTATMVVNMLILTQTFVIKKNNATMKNEKWNTKICEWNLIWMEWICFICSKLNTTNNGNKDNGSSNGNGNGNGNGNNNRNGSDRSPSEIETVCNAHGTAGNAGSNENARANIAHRGYEICGMRNHKTEQATGKFNWFKIILFATYTQLGWVRTCVQTHNGIPSDFHLSGKKCELSLRMIFDRKIERCERNTRERKDEDG